MRRIKYFVGLIFVIEGNRQNFFHNENFPIYSTSSGTILAFIRYFIRYYISLHQVLHQVLSQYLMKANIKPKRSTYTAFVLLLFCICLLVQ